MEYFLEWPEYNIIAESIDGTPIGYVMGKSEGEGEQWHGHVTALTVCPQYRRLGIAAKLMQQLEKASEQGRMWFVDLFVRVSNADAIAMYRKFGYSVYRRILEYYGSPVEDAYDMRKSLSRDVDKKSIIPLTDPVHAEDV